MGNRDKPGHPMANRRTINRDILPLLVERHKAGESLRKLVSWLAEQGIKTGIETVRRELARAGFVAEVPAEVVIPAAEPETLEERRKLLRYEVAQERRDARVDKDADWKRYHSALRLSQALLQIDAKAIAPPAPEPPAPSAIPVAQPTQADLDRAAQSDLN